MNRFISTNRKYIAVIILIVLAGIVALGQLRQSSDTLEDTSFQNSSSMETNTKNDQPEKLFTDKVATLPVINNIIDQDTNGLDVSVSMIDLNSGQRYEAGASNRVFKAASTAKILTAIDYLQKVQRGEATLDQQIAGATARQHIQQMIVISSDVAWHAIRDYVGEQQQQDFAHQIGLSSFTGDGYNTMTTDDMAKLLAMLYKRSLLNEYYTDFLLDYMANTTSTNLVQAVLPAEATVYHKYGQVWGYLNDATIITYQGHQYALVIFTNNPDGTDERYDAQVNLMHQISKQIFDDVINKRM